MTPKGHRICRIDDRVERLLMDITQRTMKEAGAHRPVCLDDG
jgi:hypothetical protein